MIKIIIIVDKKNDVLKKVIIFYKKKQNLRYISLIIKSGYAIIRSEEYLFLEEEHMKKEIEKLSSKELSLLYTKTKEFLNYLEKEHTNIEKLRAEK